MAHVCHLLEESRSPQKPRFGGSSSRADRVTMPVPQAASGSETWRVRRQWGLVFDPFQESTYQVPSILLLLLESLFNELFSVLNQPAAGLKSRLGLIDFQTFKTISNFPFQPLENERVIFLLCCYAQKLKKKEGKAQT